MRVLPFLLASFLAISTLACEVGARSGQGLRLPNGDVAKGEQAFQRLGCSGCHSIAGEEGTTQATEGLVVVLGGEVGHVETHGELVTSIVNPSHGIPREYPREDVTEGGLSKMANLNEAMSVKDLIDLTEYLQSKYSFSPYEVYVD